MALEVCNLSVGVTLGTGDFGNGKGSTVDLSGYRMTASIAKNGIPSMNVAQLRIYGLDASIMNSLTRVGQIPTSVRKNVVVVRAGLGDDSNLALAFSGVLMDAWADYDAAPEVAFNITAATGYLQNMKPVLPSSYTGATDIAVIMADLAKKMGYTLENNGVTGVILSSPYLPGTARMQALAAADQADIFLVFEDDPTGTSGGIMAIFPKNGSRATPVPLIQPPPEGSMDGYPSYVGPGMIKVRSLYNPAVRFGGNIQIKSSLTPAEGLWRVVQLTHSLSSQFPNGDWFTEIIANKFLAASQ